MKKVGKIFEIVSYIFISILFFIPIVIIVLIDYVRNEIIILKQFKKLKNFGYKISKVKDNGKRVYLFSKELLVVKFLQNEIYDISFDGGKTYISIFESNIGTPQEKEHLKYLYFEYHTCDYRDRDMYDSTVEFIHFIIKNISTSKG